MSRLQALYQKRGEKGPGTHCACTKNAKLLLGIRLFRSNLVRFWLHAVYRGMEEPALLFTTTWNAGFRTSKVSGQPKRSIK